MGETQPTLFPLDFNRSIVLEDRPERLTADAGVLALRQIDHRLGVTNWLATHLTDPRNQDLITHPQVELLRTRLYLLAQGHRDADDADRLGLDPAFRLAVSQRRGTTLLEHYRQRGTFEGHLGEFKDAFDPALSSSPRVKAHYRGCEPAQRYPSRNAFACNEALLLLHALAFNLANVGREGLQQATGWGWTIRSFREHVLKTPARMLLHARRAVVVINDIAAYYWRGLARFVATLRPQPVIARAPFNCASQSGAVNKRGSWLGKCANIRSRTRSKAPVWRVAHSAAPIYRRPRRTARSAQNVFKVVV